MSTKKETVTFENLLTEDTYTMYSASKIMSTVLGKYVREQMLYNYRSKKLIRVNSEGKVTKEDLIVFIQKRIDKNSK